MSGATFSVTPVDAEAEPLITEATDAAGDVDLSNLALAVDTDYTIAETKAPDGFKLDAEAAAVHIDADGTVALSGEAPASYTLDTTEDGAFVLTCSDEPYVLQLLKTDPDGSVLPDASFDVTGQFAGGGVNERERPDGCAGDDTACLAAHSGADVHARRDRRAGGLSAACRLRAARAPGQPAQRRRVGAHMLP